MSWIAGTYPASYENSRNLKAISSNMKTYTEAEMREMKGWEISWLLQKQPQFIDAFAERLNELDSGDISWLLREQPQLKSYFEIFHL